MTKRPDITMHRFGDTAFLRPRTAAANAWLSRKFAQVEGDLTSHDIMRIVAQAVAMGFTVVEA